MLQHPWLLAGMAAAAAPLLIHLFGQRRAPKIPFAAFDFLLAVNARLARREQLRKWLLLALRTLAMLLLPLALARPMPEPAAGAIPANTTIKRLILVIDTSPSMEYVWEGSTLLARAQAQARAALSYLAPGDPAMLISAGAQPHLWSDGLTADHGQVRTAIDALRITPGERADLGAAMASALAQCGADGTGATVLVISDLAHNSFQHVQPITMISPPQIRLQDAAERGAEPLQALPNLAVEKVTVEPSGGGWEEKQIKVRVRNYGTTAVQQRSLTVHRGDDDNAVQSGYVDIPPGQVVEKVFTHRFDGPGVYHGTVQLAAGGDGYAADDLAYFVATIAPGVRVLAINGDPRTLPQDDELYFVERALATIPQGDAPLQLKQVSIDEAEVTLMDLSAQNTDVVLLANVSMLPPAAIDSLRNFVTAGGSLLFAMGDRVNFEAANKAFGELLPHPLRDMHRAEDTVAGTPALGFAELDWQHPVLRSAGVAFEESLRAARTHLYFNLDVGAGLQARTIIRFDNGAPALIEARPAPTTAQPARRGRVMWLATSVDRGMTDLPVRSAFPALLQRIVRYLAGALDSTQLAPLRFGEGTALAMPNVELPTGVAELAWKRPDGQRIQAGAVIGRGENVGDGSLLSGIYRAEFRAAGVAGERGEWKPFPAYDIAINPSLDESDTGPVQTKALLQTLIPSQGDHAAEASFLQIITSSAARDRQTNTTHDPLSQQRGWAFYLLAGLCAVFIAESLLASRG